MDKIFELEVRQPEVISTNDMYYHPVRKTKNGRYVSYFCPSSSLKSFQSYYKECFDQTITDEVVSQLKSGVERYGTVGIEIKLEYGMPSSDLWDHDVSNFIKSIEDCVVKRTGLDDVYHTRVVAEKQVCDNFLGDWFLRITLSQYTINKFESNGGTTYEVRTEETGD